MTSENFSYAGLDILVSNHLPKRADWSACRSPARAKRRHKLGHKQHVTSHDQSFIFGEKAFITSKTLDAIRKRIDQDMIKMMTVESTETTYACPDESISKLTFDSLKESMKRIGISQKDFYSDQFTKFGIIDSWPYSPKNKYHQYR